MGEEFRKTGINVLGDVPWGTHICQFYQTRKDLIEILVPYFKAGLGSNELCLWVTSEPLGVEKAKAALKKAVKNLDEYLAKGQMEVLDYSEWYTKSGSFEADKVLQAWAHKERQALEKGFGGLRAAGNMFWLKERDWRDFTDYEVAVDNAIAKQRVIVICSYCANKCGVPETVDVISNHKLTLARRRNKWELLRSPQNEGLEKALSEAKEHYGSVVETFPDVFFSISADGALTSLNPAFEQITGFSPEEMVGKPFTTVVHRDDWPVAIQKFEQVLCGEIAPPFELRFLSKSGQYLVGEVIGKPHIEDGKVVEVFGFVRDITERKKTDEALRASEMKYRSLVTNIPDISWTYDRKGKIIFMSPNVETILGYTPEEMYQRGYRQWLERTHPDDMKRLEEGLRQQVEKGIPLDVEYRFQRKDGDWIWIHTRATVTYKKDGNTYVDGVTSDVTKRKKAEEALRQSEEKYHSLVNNIPDVVWTGNGAGNIIFISPNVEVVMGYTPEEVCQMGYRMWLDRVHPDDLEHMIEAIRLLVEKGTPFDIEVRFRRKDGNWIWLRDKAVTSYEKDGMRYIDGLASDITERKRAEEVLRQSEERFRTLFESTREGVVISVPGGRILSANPAAAAILGYDSPQELVGMLGPELYADLGQRKAVQAALLSKGYIEDMELTLRKKDGTPVQVLGSSMMYRDQQGKPMRVESIWMDITERKRAEEALKKSEEKLRVMFQSVAEGIILTDLEGNILETNEAAVSQGGYNNKEELIGRNTSELSSPKERARAMENLKRLVVEGHHGPTEYTFTRKDGTEFPGEVNSCLIRDASGNPAGFIAVTRDITERKRAEEALRQSEEKLRVMFQSMAEGVTVTDIEGNILDANEEVVRQMGYTKEEYIGRKGFEFLSPKDHTRAAEDTIRRLTEGYIGTVEYAFIKKDGTEHPAEVNASFIRDASGNPVAIVSITRDITERKRMEEQVKEYSENLERMVEMRTRELKDAQEKLVRTEKLAAIGQLAGGVGHELRNPLAAIKTSAYFLKMKLGKTAEEKVNKHLDMLDKQVGVCDKIITDLLDFSRPGKTNIVEVDINQIVQGMVKAISVPKNVEISTSLATNPAMVMADWGQLERVFSNLISNAIQAMPSGGRLSLSTSQSGGFVEMKVADTGVGIPQENLDKIFEPLFTTKAKGVGLGLAIARALVERHGGTIGVESQVGKGTTFTVRLPIVGKEVRSHE